MVKCKALLAVLWLFSDRKNILIGSLWLESRTIVRFSPCSFMAGKSVEEIENTNWPNWHNFKFYDWEMSIKLKSERF